MIWSRGDLSVILRKISIHHLKGFRVISLETCPHTSRTTYLRRDYSIHRKLFLEMYKRRLVEKGAFTKAIEPTCDKEKQFEFTDTAEEICSTGSIPFGYVTGSRYYFKKYFQLHDCGFSWKQLKYHSISIKYSNKKSVVSNFDVNACSHSNLVKAFRWLALDNFSEQLSHASKYGPVLRALADNISKFDLRELLEIGKALAVWRKGAYKKETDALILALDEECFQRFNKLWCNIQCIEKDHLKLADIMFWIGIFKSSKYLNVAVPHWAENCAKSPCKFLLPVAFFYGISNCPRSDLLSPSNNNVARILNLCELGEILSFAFCIHFKMSEPESMCPALRESIKTHLRLHHINGTLLLLLTKFLSYIEMTKDDAIIIHKLEQHLTQRITSVSVDGCGSVLRCAGYLGVDDPDFVSAVVKRLTPVLHALQTKYLLDLICDFGSINSTKESSNFLEQLGEELVLREDLHMFLGNQYKVNQVLFENNIFNFDLWEKCVLDFKSNPKDHHPGSLSGCLFVADSLIEVFHPDFEGPRLNAHTKEKLFNLYFRFTPHSKINIWNGANESVLECLRTVAGKEQVLPIQILPYSVHDFVLCTDKNGSYLPVPDFFHLPPWDVKSIKKSTLSDGKIFIAVWCVPLWGRKYVSKELKSHVWTKQRALKELGYNSIQVDSATWMRRGNISSAVWLESMLQNAVFSTQVANMSP